MEKKTENERGRGVLKKLRDLPRGVGGGVKKPRVMLMKYLLRTDSH